MAGLTAASTLPRSIASNILIFKRRGPKIVIPIISNVAGKNDKSNALLPIFLKLLISRFSPDLVRIIIKAICLKYEEISIKDLSIILKTLGPNKTPKRKELSTEDESDQGATPEGQLDLFSTNQNNTQALPDE